MGKRYQPKDRYFLKAKEDGFRARSAFKLEEIASRLGLLKRGMGVIDLGAAPGGFLQVISRAVGDAGWAVGVDLVPIAPLPQPNIVTLQASLLGPGFEEVLRSVVQGRRADLVTSDMAPKTSGIHTVDESRSLELCRAALGVAARNLKPRGAFVCKVFMGEDFKLFEAEVKSLFPEVQVIRPKATRERSIEVYLVGKGFRAREVSGSPVESGANPPGLPPR